MVTETGGRVTAEVQRRVPGAGNLGRHHAYKPVKPHLHAPTSPELRRTLKRQIVLALAAVPAVVGLVLWWLPRAGAAAALLRAYAAVVVALVVGWWLALGLRRLLWRVGRRLAFSYFLIGVVPIPLLALLALVAAYIMNGFFLGHLYRDALSSTATELRLAVERRFEQLSRGWTPPEPTPVPVSYAYYHDGRKLGGDARAPRRWQDWWVAGTFETPVPSPIGPQFVALEDGRPTLVAAVSEERYGVLALYGGDLERDLSERSGVWVELVRADESGERALAFTFQQRDYALRLPRLGRESEELKAFFHPGIDEPGFYRRPALIWAEISRPFLDLATGEPATEYVYATLTGSPETSFYHLISRSAEVDTFAYLVFFALAFALFDIWVLAVLMAILMISGLSRAVNRLSSATERVRHGDFSARIEVRRTDQIGELQRSFNQMAANLEELVASATQKEVLEKELEIARELQRSLLPHELAVDEALSFATHFAPSAAIGGDYYDVLPLCPEGGGERFAVVVADVSGHGLSAGLRMAMVKSALQLLCEQESRPEEILGRLDTLLRPRGRGPLPRSSRGFVTATLALVDRDGGELVITNAGHSPTYVWRRGQVTEIVLPSPPLGALGRDFGQRTVALEPGDAVVWLSDGMIEATDGEDPFGYEGIVLALEEIAGDEPHDAASLRDHLLRALEEHTGGRLPDDDRTLVVMVYRPATADAAATPDAGSSTARSSAA